MGNDDDDSYGPHDNELEDDDDEEEKGENILNEIGSPSSSKKSSGTTGTGLDSIQYDDKVQMYIDPEGKQRWRCLWLWCNKTFFLESNKSVGSFSKSWKGGYCYL